VITGDIMHHPVQMAEPDLKDPTFAMITTRRSARGAASSSVIHDRQAYVIGSHPFCDPTGGWIVA